METQIERLSQTLKQGFGAPGDWGYETREGKALFEAYKLLASLLADIKLVREALAPFAAIETGISGADEDLWFIHDGDQLTVGDFRKAKALVTVAGGKDAA